MHHPVSLPAARPEPLPVHPPKDIVDTCVGLIFARREVTEELLVTGYGFPPSVVGACFDAALDAAAAKVIRACREIEVEFGPLRNLAAPEAA